MRFTEWVALAALISFGTAAAVAVGLAIGGAIGGSL